MNNDIVTIAFDTLTGQIKKVQLDHDRRAYSKDEVIDMIAKMRVSFMQRVNQLTQDHQ